jgi:predicted ribosome quality control (RQC) complex YloA/Tae2 family protein
VTVEDFYAGGAPRTLELDPTLTPQENLARLFKRARRASRGRDVVAARLAAARAELESLAERERAAGTARSFGEILTAASIDWGEAARSPTARLWAPGGLAMGSGRRARGAAPAPRQGPGRRFLLDGGWEVRVGRSNAENDELTHRFARPDDIWLHASGVSGSHVVLRMPERGDNPPREVLEAAAAIAARFSKAKHAGTVPVLWTRKRYVRKPRGAAPGLAVCTHEKTVFVRPGLPDGQGD